MRENKEENKLTLVHAGQSEPNTRAGIFEINLEPEKSMNFDKQEKNLSKQFTHKILATSVIIGRMNVREKSGV